MKQKDYVAENGCAKPIGIFLLMIGILIIPIGCSNEKRLERSVAEIERYRKILAIAPCQCPVVERSTFPDFNGGTFPHHNGVQLYEIPESWMHGDQIDSARLNRLLDSLMQETPDTTSYPVN